MAEDNVVNMIDFLWKKKRKAQAEICEIAFKEQKQKNRVHDPDGALDKISKEINDLSHELFTNYEDCADDARECSRQLQSVFYSEILQDLQSLSDRMKRFREEHGL